MATISGHKQIRRQFSAIILTYYAKKRNKAYAVVSCKCASQLLCEITGNVRQVGLNSVRGCYVAR